MSKKNQSNFRWDEYNKQVQPNRKAISVRSHNNLYAYTHIYANTVKKQGRETRIEKKEEAKHDIHSIPNWYIDEKKKKKKKTHIYTHIHIGEQSDKQNWQQTHRKIES